MDWDIAAAEGGHCAMVHCYQHICDRAAGSSGMWRFPTLGFGLTTWWRLAALAAVLRTLLVVDNLQSYPTRVLGQSNRYRAA
jgi:hypothetical protein